MTALLGPAPTTHRPEDPRTSRPEHPAVGATVLAGSIIGEAARVADAIRAAMPELVLELRDTLGLSDRRPDGHPGATAITVLTPSLTDPDVWLTIVAERADGQPQVTITASDRASCPRPVPDRDVDGWRRAIRPPEESPRVPVTADRGSERSPTSRHPR